MLSANDIHFPCWWLRGHYSIKKEFNRVMVHSRTKTWILDDHSVEGATLSERRLALHKRKVEDIYPLKYYVTSIEDLLLDKKHKIWIDNSGRLINTSKMRKKKYYSIVSLPIADVKQLVPWKYSILAGGHRYIYYGPYDYTNTHINVVLYYSGYIVFSFTVGPSPRKRIML